MHPEIIEVVFIKEPLPQPELKPAEKNTGSIVLMAHCLARNGQLPIDQAARYTKTQATFSDALAAVRQQLWHPANFFTSRSASDMIKLPRALYSGLCHALCYAA